MLMKKRRRGSELRRQTVDEIDEGDAAQNPFPFLRPSGRASSARNRRQKALMLFSRSPERVLLQHHADRDDSQGCWGCVPARARNFHAGL